jgi:hypothetical protein
MPVETMVNLNKIPESTVPLKEVKLPCGCQYRDEGWMLTRITISGKEQPNDHIGLKLNV